MRTMMLDPTHPIAKLLKEDRRYKLDAYVFVFEALNFAHQSLGMGTERTGDTEEGEEENPKESERHLTGQQLCEAVRLYALEQYGYMAQCVLESWGIKATGDLGEIVFNLIRIGQMRKTKDDTRADFENVFDFETGFRESFEIKLPES